MSTPNERIDLAIGWIDNSPFEVAERITLIEMLKKLKEKPEPKPMKLEAGCKVKSTGEIGTGTVIAVLHGSAWVDFGSYRSTCGLRKLVIVEEATPEVEDSVMTMNKRPGIIAKVPKQPPAGWHTIRFSDGDTCDYLREAITILYKATTPEE